MFTVTNLPERRLQQRDMGQSPGYINNIVSGSRCMCDCVSALAESARAELLPATVLVYRCQHGQVPLNLTIARFIASLDNRRSRGSACKARPHRRPRFFYNSNLCMNTLLSTVTTASPSLPEWQKTKLFDGSVDNLAGSITIQVTLAIYQRR